MILKEKKRENKIESPLTFQIMTRYRTISIIHEITIRVKTI